MRAAVLVLVATLFLAGCASPGSDIERLEVMEGEDGQMFQLAATVERAGATGRSNHDTITWLPLDDGRNVTLWPSMLHSYASHLISREPLFPNPYQFPIDKTTGNPWIDGEAVPLFRATDGAASWSFSFSGRAWQASQTPSGVEASSDGARYVAHFERPWIPESFRLEVEGITELDLRVAREPVDEGLHFRDPSTFEVIVTGRLVNGTEAAQAFEMPLVAGRRAHSIAVTSCPPPTAGLIPLLDQNTPAQPRIRLQMREAQEPFSEWEPGCGHQTMGRFCPKDPHTLVGQAELELTAQTSATILYAWYRHAGGDEVYVMDGSLQQRQTSDGFACA